jgi:hypothetical protein
LVDNAIPICWLLILTFRIDFDNDELVGGTTPIQRTIVPYWKDAIGLSSIIHYTKSKKNHGDGDQFVDDKPFIDERKRSGSKWQLRSSGSKVARNYEAQIAIFCILAAVDRFSRISRKVKNRWGKLESHWGKLESLCGKQKGIGESRKALQKAESRKQKPESHRRNLESR